MIRSSNRGFASFCSTNANNLIDSADKHLGVANLFDASRSNNSFHGVLNPSIRKDNFAFNFWQKTVGLQAQEYRLHAKKICRPKNRWHNDDLSRPRSKPSLRGNAAEFDQVLGPYSQGLGRRRGFHFIPVHGLVHPGQSLNERVSARRHPTGFFEFAKCLANAEAPRWFEAARYHQQPKNTLDLNSHGHER
jgi:hypothetical protein